MAVLPDADRKALFAKFMSDASSSNDSTGDISKVDLRAAFNAADDWVNDNAVAFNTAIPLPARTVLSAANKAKLLMEVVKRRWEVS